MYEIMQNTRHAITEAASRSSIGPEHYQFRLDNGLQSVLGDVREVTPIDIIDIDGESATDVAIPFRSA